MKREEEKEEHETGTVKRRCECFVSVEAFDIFSQGRDLESCGDVPWVDPLKKLDNWSTCEPDSCALVRVVLDLTDVLVFPSSVVRCVRFLRVALIRKLLCRSPFLSPKSVHIVVQIRGKR